MIPPTAQEVLHRLGRSSQLRELFLSLHVSAKRANEAGELPYKPSYDVRTDAEYWRKLQREQHKQ